MGGQAGRQAGSQAGRKVGGWLARSVGRFEFRNVVEPQSLAFFMTGHISCSTSLLSFQSFRFPQLQDHIFRNNSVTFVKHELLLCSKNH